MSSNGNPFTRSLSSKTQEKSAGTVRRPTHCVVRKRIKQNWRYVLEIQTPCGQHSVGWRRHQGLFSLLPAHFCLLLFGGRRALTLVTLSLCLRLILKCSCFVLFTTIVDLKTFCKFIRYCHSTGVLIVIQHFGGLKRSFCLLRSFVMIVFTESIWRLSNEAHESHFGQFDWLIPVHSGDCGSLLPNLPQTSSTTLQLQQRKEEILHMLTGSIDSIHVTFGAELVCWPLFDRLLQRAWNRFSPSWMYYETNPNSLPHWYQHAATNIRFIIKSYTLPLKLKNFRYGKVIRLLLFISFSW